MTAHTNPYLYSTPPSVSKVSSSSPSQKQVFFILFSSMVACFDFLIYFYLADIISLTFFPSNSDPFVARLQTISLLSAGFLSRPIGGLLIGRYGDLHGRKPALLISLCCLVATTLMMACLPTYAQAGLLAPVLFIVARLFQGMAFGAYVPLSWVFIAEHASKKNLATYCSLAMAGLTAGNLLAAILSKFMLTSYSQADLFDYGWRIPSIIAGILSILALFLWRSTQETPIFLTLKSQRPKAPHYLQILPTFKQKTAMTLGMMIAFIHASLIVVAVLLLPKLITLKFSLPTSFTSYAILIGLSAQLIGCLFYGMVADRIGTGKALILGAITLMIQAMTFYINLSHGNGDYILLLYALLGFCSGMVGLFPSTLIQLFPTNVRLTSVSVTYNCASAIAGTALPAVLFYFTSFVSFSPALYLTFVGMTAVVMGIYLHQLSLFADLDQIKPSIASAR